MTLAMDLAQRILALRYEALPEAALANARAAIADTVAVTLAGSAEDCVRIVAGTAGDAPGPCLVLGQGRRAALLDAVLINATASHALDFDDVAASIGGHPSVPLVAAIIAVGEITGASGRDALAAYVAGFETSARLGRAVHPRHYDKGWHPTATLGIFGTVAAAARLLGLTAERTATALAMAASLASGIKANFGTMTKPLHIGHSARNGVLAALLARDGFTAGADALEHPHGFFEVFNGAGTHDAGRVLEGWGDPLDIIEHGPWFKRYPCCGSTHPAVMAMLRLVREHGLDADMAADIEVLTNPRRLPHTDNPEPASGLAAKFSIQYAVARALTDGAVVLAHFEGTAHRDAAPRRLMALIRVGAHPAMPAHSDSQFAAEVIVTTRDGRRLAARAGDGAEEGPEAPMARDERRAKFEDCARRAPPAVGAGALFAMLEDLDSLAAVGDLTVAIAGPADAGNAAAE